MDKFHLLLKQIEKEYDLLCAENTALKEIIARDVTVNESPISNISNKQQQTNISPQQKRHGTSGNLLTNTLASSASSKRDSVVNASHILSNKLKSKYKIKSASTRIFRSSTTTPNSVNKLVRQFEWHKDGVWFVTASVVRNNRILIGSASADGTACVADATRLINDFYNTSNLGMMGSSSTSASIVQQYSGQSGSSTSPSTNIGGLSSFKSAVERTTGGVSSSKMIGGGAQGANIITSSSSPTSFANYPGLPHTYYVGHAGSVNCIRFHSSHDLVLTAGGEGTSHIWRCPPISTMEPLQSRSNSQDDDHSPDSQGPSGGFVPAGLGSSVDGDSSTLNNFVGGSIQQQQQQQQQAHLIKQPLKELTGHTSTVISCDWLFGVDQCVTASWDRTANIYDIKTGELVVQLAGHDQELTHVCSHQSLPLIVTASDDTTFRLWDFREAIHSVCVFQGHSESVSSATFFGTDKVISASDDRTCKIWDLRNMRSPLTTIDVEAPINKISASQSHNLLAIPLDNRNVRFYDVNGNRINRLPRTHHQRMATCTTFVPAPPQAATSSASSPSSSTANNLFLLTCGFDKRVALWALPNPAL